MMRLVIEVEGLIKFENLCSWKVQRELICKSLQKIDC